MLMDYRTEKPQSRDCGFSGVGSGSPYRSELRGDATRPVLLR